jgi:hypothetical protein
MPTMVTRTSPRLSQNERSNLTQNIRDLHLCRSICWELLEYENLPYRHSMMACWYYALGNLFLFLCPFRFRTCMYV